MSRLLTSSRRWIGVGRLASLALAAGLLGACSEVADDPLPPVGPAAKVHPTGWLLEYSEQFHGEAIRAADWDMSSCQTCHGADYAGGFVEVSCNTCHARTPESCSTCHGTGGVSAGPPEDLSPRSTAATVTPSPASTIRRTSTATAAPRSPSASVPASTASSQRTTPRLAAAPTPTATAAAPSA
jgi:hypothetical protein